MRFSAFALLALVAHDIDQNDGAGFAKRAAAFGEKGLLVVGRQAFLAKPMTPPKRVEIYDNSHTGGSQPIGAMVVASGQTAVFGVGNLLKSSAAVGVGKASPAVLSMRMICC